MFDIMNVIIVLSLIIISAGVWAIVYMLKGLDISTYSAKEEPVEDPVVQKEERFELPDDVMDDEVVCTYYKPDKWKMYRTFLKNNKYEEKTDETEPSLREVAKSLEREGHWTEPKQSISE